MRAFIDFILFYMYSFDSQDRVVVYLLLIIIHQIFFRARDWLRRVTWSNMPQLRLGNIQEYAPGDIPQFTSFAIYVRAFGFYP